VRQKDLRAFREQRASELRILKEILQTYNVINDPSPLEQSIRMCTIKESGAGWHYSFTDLLFEPLLDELRHTRPRGIEYLAVELSVNLQGECFEDKTLTDPFSHLGVSVVVKGFDVQANPFTSAWHLDRHGIEKGVQKPSLLVHPCYHIHHGGKAIWDAPDFNYGSHLLLETPRLAHLPLDGILAIDFVLSNYMPTTWHKLRDEEPRYVDIVHESQKRCWYAYMMAMSTYWSDEDTKPWQAHLLLPQLPKPKK
jgi:hypothetical protein